MTTHCFTPGGRAITTSPLHTTSSDILASLDPPRRAIVEALGVAFQQEGEALFLVGGVVRDALLERESQPDLDLTTAAPPDRIRAIVESFPGTTVWDIGERFGTIGAVIEGKEKVEITTFRSEQYTPGSRHPEVAFGDSIEDDLARRDLTINAIALDLATLTLVDPWYGQADLAMGLLRAVGDPDQRFRDDPLRLLRVARFVAELGFAVETATFEAMTRQAETLRTISAERILAEITRLLCGQFADHGLETLVRTGLFQVAMPELTALEESAWDTPGVHREKDLWEHTKRVVVQAPPRPVVRWAALLHDSAKPLTRTVDARGEVHFYDHDRIGAQIAKRLLDRLKADKATRVAVARLVEMHLRCASYDTTTWTDSAVRRLALEADGIMPDLLDLAAADVTSARAIKQRAAAARVQGLREHLARLEAEQALAELQSPLDGIALMSMFQRPPGKWIAEIKAYLRDLVIEGDLAPNDTETAARLATARLKEMDQA